MKLFALKFKEAQAAQKRATKLNQAGLLFHTFVPHGVILRNECARARLYY